MKRKLSSFFLGLSIILSVAAQVRSDTPMVKPPQLKPETKPTFKIDFDKSNAILLEKSIRSLPIVPLIAPLVNQKDKLIIVSMERPDTNHRSVNNLIEDNLIASLAEAGYKVLERDLNLIWRLNSESENRFKMADFDRFSSMVKNGQKSKKDPEIITGMVVADKILSYRVLECGIRYSKAEKEKSTYAGSSSDRERIATTRLHVRLISAETGEIELATILENEVRDIIPADLTDKLKNISHNLYPPTLPVMSDLLPAKPEPTNRSAGIIQQLQKQNKALKDRLLAEDNRRIEQDREIQRLKAESAKKPGESLNRSKSKNRIWYIAGASTGIISLIVLLVRN